MSWSLAPALRVLRDQINTTWPDRNKVSDGTIASRQHSINNPYSDHEPDADDIVTATDITHDPVGGPDMFTFTEALRRSRDSRIKYVIFDRRMFSSYWARGIAPYTWRTYSGSNPHTKHAHISNLGGSHRFDTRLWIPDHMEEPMAVSEQVKDFFTRFQTALIEAGYDLPKYGPDGVPGDETFGAFTEALKDAKQLGVDTDHRHPHRHTLPGGLTGPEENA